MRDARKLVLGLSLLFTGCSSSGNPLIGTWVTADSPIPSGCYAKVVFTKKTMYFESPGLPNLVPPQ